MPFILVDNLRLYFRLRRSQRAKRLQLLFHYDGFEVIAPPRILNREILSFIAERQSWMRRVFQRTLRQERSLPKHFKCAENRIFYRGKEWVLETRNENGLDVWVKSEHVLGVNVQLEDGRSLEERLLSWMKQQTHAIIKQVVERVCPSLGHWPQKIVLREQKTRWGSCGINNTLQINKRLIFAPEGVLEYIVVHELCHLIHRNHSRRFWQKVEQYCPEYPQHRAWLREKGAALMAMGMNVPILVN